MGSKSEEFVAQAIAITIGIAITMASATAITSAGAKTKKVHFLSGSGAKGLRKVNLLRPKQLQLRLALLLPWQPLLLVWFNLVPVGLVGLVLVWLVWFWSGSGRSGWSGFGLVWLRFWSGSGWSGWSGFGLVWLVWF
jgi:hypothetical protein